jgi:hypothetical protein
MRYPLSSCPIRAVSWSIFTPARGVRVPASLDADSAVIRSFGIMNQLVEPDEGHSMHCYGIPYPGDLLPRCRWDRG